MQQKRLMSLFESKAASVLSWLLTGEKSMSTDYSVISDHATGSTTLIVGEDLWKAFSSFARMDFLAKAKNENIAIKIGSIFNYTNI